MEEGSSQSHWTREFFVERGELFLRVMESEKMLKRGEEAAKVLAEYLRSKGLRTGKVLEVGCGSGRVLVPLVKEGYEAVGVDISPLFIRRARERAESEGVADRVTFVVGDARELAKLVKGHAPFDAVLFIWTTIIGYYDEETDVSILKQCREVAEPRALLIIAATANQTLIAFLNAFMQAQPLFADYGDFAVVEFPSYDPVTSRATSRWAYYEKVGNDLKYLGELSHSLRVYALHELVGIAKRAGWCFVEAFYSFKEREPFKPVGPLNAVFRPCE